MAKRLKRPRRRAGHATKRVKSATVKKRAKAPVASRKKRKGKSQKTPSREAMAKKLVTKAKRAASKARAGYVLAEQALAYAFSAQKRYYTEQKKRAKKRKPRRISESELARDAMRDILETVASRLGAQTHVSAESDKDSADAILTVRGADIQSVFDALTDYVPSGRYWIQVAQSGQVTREGARHGKEVKRPSDYQRGRGKSVANYPNKLMPVVEEAHKQYVSPGLAGLVKIDLIRVRLSWNDDDETPEEFV